ncbi:hypothetical protein CAC42_1673 [Sphaceloma murrayae]|uniref:Thiaminase-2/PQQC domain-containing protein n=1 Tax=Sphaceloma murrayae TaxID=2082308 RepID=A0A2K1QI77_9PEZI|nr:hypothetical protein CAC42_1673 [Sphaceloma murrayae]
MALKLTDRLMALDRPGFKAATQHHWLRLIGQGKLPREAQLKWLHQDRMYALSYVAFIGSLVAKVKLPATVDRRNSLEWRISDMLIEALVNIRRELTMFEDILRQHYGWGRDPDEPVPEANPATTVYQSLFCSATAPNVPLVAGLAALWATERCYLESWRFAKQQNMASDGLIYSDDVVRQILIPNWTSTEFESFVNDVGQLMNELSERDGSTEADRVQCESFWRQVLWCEERFWPDIEQDGTPRE